MGLLEQFLQRIAMIYDLDQSEISIDKNNLFISSSEPLSALEVFFPEEVPPDAEDQQCLETYLETFELINATNVHFQNKADPNEKFYILKLRLINENIRHGVYEILGDDGSRLSIVFTGSFSGSNDRPTLVEYPEMLLALCTLENASTLVSIGWRDIFECLGPFAICKGDLPLTTLAGNGLFVFKDRSFSYRWNDELPEVALKRKNNIPNEAEKAYLAALESSNGADMAFFQLYRVFEILFAVGLKDRISTSNLTDVLKIFQDHGRLNELTMLTTLINGSHYSFNRFSIRNFQELFDNHMPNGKYNGIKKWLNDRSSSNFPSDDLRAEIIYYVRCSLVHSKLGEEPFLVGPFSVKQEEALIHLFEDTLSVVRSLIFM